MSPGDKVACPECSGLGVIHGFGCPGFRPIQLPCSMCMGVKEVDRRVLQWIAQGSQLREARRARGKTLREEAQSRSLAASLLSDMERGVVQPVFPS